jgi:hypothetical protein
VSDTEDAKLQEILLGITDHLDKLYGAASAHNQVLRAHNAYLQKQEKRLAFLEDMLLKQEADQ